MGRCVLSMDSSPTVGSCTLQPTTNNPPPFLPPARRPIFCHEFDDFEIPTRQTRTPHPPPPKARFATPKKNPPPQKTVASAAQPIKKLPLQLTYLPTPTMNTPLLVARRAAAAAAVTSSVCLSCRRSLFRRQFSSVGGRAALPAEFQSYRLNTTAAASPQPRGGPDTSISAHLPVVDSPPPPPPLPRLHETRPPSPPQQPSPLGEGQGQAQEEYAAAAAQQQQQEQPPTPAPQEQQQQQETEQSTTTTTSSAQSTSTTTSAATPKTTTTTTTTTRPRSKLRAPRKAAITLSPAAVAHLRALLDQPAPKLIKVGVRNRGCSGLAYHLEYVDKAGAFDEAVEQDGVRVLIDSKALFSIIGSEMDWVEDKLNQRFVFRNPNISEFFLPGDNPGIFLSWVVAC